MEYTRPDMTPETLLEKITLEALSVGRQIEAEGNVRIKKRKKQRKRAEQQKECEMAANKARRNKRHKNSCRIL
jgi:hypothetical protein